MINNEITTQVTRKLDELKEDLNTQILEVINPAIAEKVFASIQNVLGVANSVLNATRGHQSGRLDMIPEDHLRHMDHRTQGLDKGHRDHSSNADHWSKGLNKGPRDHSSHMGHQSG